MNLPILFRRLRNIALALSLGCLAWTFSEGPRGNVSPLFLSIYCVMVAVSLGMAERIAELEGDKSCSFMPSPPGPRYAQAGLRALDDISTAFRSLCRELALEAVQRDGRDLVTFLDMKEVIPAAMREIADEMEGVASGERMAE